MLNKHQNSKIRYFHREVIMRKQIILDLKEKIESTGNNIDPILLATLIIKWLHAYPSLQKEFLDHRIDISVFMNMKILDIPNYPIRKSSIDFYDLEALKRQIDISIKGKHSSIYQPIKNLLEILFVIQKPDMKCNICHGIYGFDLWKEIHTNRLVYCCKTCNFAEYVNGEVKNDEKPLTMPTNNDLSILYL